MNDLGDVQEEMVDRFEFMAARPQRTLDKTLEPPANHRNLLACSALHGKLYAGIGKIVRICSLSDLRDKPSKSSDRYESNAPITTVDLSQIDVSEILHLLLLLADSLLAVLATRASDTTKTVLLFLHVTALSDGKVVCRPTLSLSGITAIAARPYDINTHYETDSLFMCITDAQTVHVHRISETEAKEVSQVSVTGALSLALDTIAAVGTSRGSVVLLNPLSGAKVGTIVEVESGWLPVQVHFAGSDYLFTTYQLDTNTDTENVIWHLRRESATSVSKDGHSPLGVLCYRFIFEDTEQDSSLTPSIMFSFIAEWNLAVVSSSLSSEIAIIAKREDDGAWVNYKLPDSREAVMPIVDGVDWVPVGMALDLNNTSTIPARDPDDPDINPMPTVVILSNTGVILSYRLVNNHVRAECSLVRKPVPLPPLPPHISEKSTSPVRPGNKRSFSSPVAEPPQQLTQPAVAQQIGFSPMKSDTKSLFSGLPQAQQSPNQTPSNLSSLENFSSSFATGDPFNYPSFQHSRTGSLGVAKQNENPSPFSSKFSFSKPTSTTSMSPSAKSSSQKPPTPPSHKRPSSFFTETSPKEPSQTPRHIPVQQQMPPVRLESKLDDSLNALRGAPSEDSLSAIRSILHEMAEELKTTFHASCAVKQQLEVLKPSVTSLIEKVSGDVNIRLNELARGFETEKELRDGASECMKKILKLHRDYETICMEDSTQREDSISHQLREEYRIAEERMVQKETEIEKSVAYVTNKLEPSELEQKARKDPGETMQMIYSCISLQGLRIKRLLNLLTSLSERAELDNQNGRRSDLGLSLARLEKLSLGPSDSGLVRKDFKASAQRRLSQNVTQNVTIVTSNLDKANAEPMHISNEVREVLRRLAMRGGRAHITVDTSLATLRTVEKDSSSVKGRPSTTTTTSVSSVNNIATSNSTPFNPQTETRFRPIQKQFSTSSMQPPPPPPPPYTLREQTTQFGSRPNRAPTEHANTTTANFTKHESLPLFGSQPPPPPQPQALSNSPPPSAISEQGNSVKKLPSEGVKRFAPSNDLLETEPSTAQAFQKPKSPDVNANEEALPTIDITSSPASSKQRPWGTIPLASFVRQSAPLYRPTSSDGSSNSKASPLKKNPQNRDEPMLKTSFTSSRQKPTANESLPSNDSSAPKGNKKPPTFDSSSSVSGLSNAKESKKSSSGEGLFAAMPPDDSFKKPSKRKTVGTGTSAHAFGAESNEKKVASDGGLFAAMPPDDSLNKPSKQKTVAPGPSVPTFGSGNSKKDTNKRPGGGSLFAAMPPDNSLKKHSKREAAVSSPLVPVFDVGNNEKEKNKSSAAGNLFAAMPPDDSLTKAPKRGIEDSQTPKGKKKSLTVDTSSSGDVPSNVKDTKKEPSGGSLFAAMPPDHSLKKPSKGETLTKAPAPVPVFGNATSAPSFSVSQSFGGTPSKQGASSETTSVQSTPDAALGVAPKTTGETTNTANSSSTLGLFGSQLSLGGGKDGSNAKDGSNDGSSSSFFGVSAPFSSPQASAAPTTSSFGASGTSPFGTFGASAFNNNTTAFSTPISGNSAATSLFQVAASKVSDTPPKSAAIRNDGDMIQSDGSSSDDDFDDARGSASRRRQGMETSGGFGDTTPQQQQRATNAFDMAANSASGGAPLFGSGGSSTATPSFGAGASGFGNTSNPGALGGGSPAPAFGATSPFGSVGSGGSAAFGTTSPFGAAPQVFGTPSSLGANPPTGFGGMAAKFGESLFGGASAGGQQTPATQPQGFGTATSGFGGASPATQSPFGSVAASANGGASPFASAAASAVQTSFGTFGRDASAASPSQGLMFGTGKPPAFTASSFYERRA